MTFLSDDIISESTDSPFIFKLDIHEVIFSSEQFLEFLPPFLRTDEIITSMKNIEIGFDKEQSYTLKQILLHCVRTLLNNFTGTNNRALSHSKMFHKKLEANYNMHHYAMLRDRRKHWELANLLLHRFITLFVSKVKVNLPKILAKDVGLRSDNRNGFGVRRNNEENARQSKLLFIYCSIVEPSILGSTKSRVLYTAPLSDFEPTMNKQVDNVQFSKVEPTLIRQITFAFLDEFGEKIIFEDASTPNFLALYLRKANK
jgi:hypothetical protein